MTVNSINYIDDTRDVLGYEENCLPILPEDFKVYIQKGGFSDTVINHPSKGFEACVLPTYNDYMGKDGGYVAIYTKDASQGLYRVDDKIYVVGQIRVKGHYEGRTFLPEGYKRGDNITQDPKILEIGSKYRNMSGCWVGGDTGGWFGIQRVWLNTFKN